MHAELLTTGGPMSAETKARILELHRKGMSAYRIAAVVRRHDCTVRDFLHANGVPKQENRNHGAQAKKKPPTPEQIRQRAAAIRAGWSEAERLSRRTSSLPEVEQRKAG